MTTTDSNGIVRFQDSDGAPTPPVLNLGFQSVSDAISLIKTDLTAARRAGVYTVANTAARTALVSDLVGKGIGPTATNPLYVHRTDAVSGNQLEWSTNGSAWTPVAPNTVLGGTAVQVVSGFSTALTLGPFPYPVAVIVQNGAPEVQTTMMVRGVQNALIPANTTQAVILHFTASHSGNARFTWHALRSA